MEVYRSPMEKILKQYEDDTVITNPHEPGKTFLRKIAYQCAYWVDRLKRIFSRRQAGDGKT
jgi:hypothetical protein